MENQEEIMRLRARWESRSCLIMMVWEGQMDQKSAQ